MKRIICMLVVVTMATPILIAQRATYVGLEAGLSKDIYSITETNLKEPDSNSTRLKNARPSSIMYGLTLRHDLNSKFFIETGFFSKTYMSAIGFKAEHGYSSFSEFRSLVIPIKLGAKINLVRDRLQLTPTVGYSFVRNYIRDGRGASGQGDGYYGTPNHFRYEYRHRSFHHATSHSLMQAGLGLDVKLSRYLLLSASANYYSGFKTVVSSDINYAVDNEHARLAQMKSNGAMKTYNLGIRFKLPGSKPKSPAGKALPSPVN